MNLRLDRHRLFDLITALELDLRLLIERYLLVSRDEEQVFGSETFGTATDRMAQDSDANLAESRVVDYLYLGDELEILRRWHSELPRETAASISKSGVHFGFLIQVRKRIAHARPLLPDDLPKATEILLVLARDSFDWPELAAALSRAQKNPDSVHSVAPVESGARTLHNLPLGDYDETGLVGRRRESEKLSKWVKELPEKRTPVITVVGPGGAGKTALVLQVLHDLVHDPACPFDLVSWVSLKTEQLTAEGVTSIHEAVLSIEQAVPAMAEALDPSFEGTLAQLADALQGLTTLIVIDNLETVSGREVLDLVDALPDSVSYLFTSREGLGEIERRFELGPLEERVAVDLLRRLARSRGLEPFAQVEQPVATEIVTQLGASPLGLKWFVSSIELGKEPEELLRHSETLVRFCVENVFESLDYDAKTVANVLYALNRPATVQELKLHRPEIGSDRLRASIQSLLRRMLVRRDLVPGTVNETFEASESLCDFLSHTPAVDGIDLETIKDADLDHRRELERHRLEASNDALRPEIVQSGDGHEASGLLLRKAVRLSKSRDFAEAMEQVKDAERLDPEFWEIHRVKGFILGQARNFDAAAQAYERALELAPSQRAAAVVKYWYAQHLTKVAESSRAVQEAREAHEILNLPKTAFELGKALTYIKEFEEAEPLLASAQAAWDPRTHLIATTQLVDTMRRRAEHEHTELLQPETAVSTLLDGLDVVERSLDDGHSDRKLAAKTRNVASDAFRYLRECPDDETSLSAVERVSRVVRRVEIHDPVIEGIDHLREHAQILANSRPRFVPALSEFFDVAPPSATPIDQNELLDHGKHVELEGVVKAWRPKDGYGFITLAGEDYFFHKNELVSPADEIRLRKHARAHFRKGSEDHRGLRASDVRLGVGQGDELAGRRLEVTRLPQVDNYLFAEDIVSGATVFVGRHAMEDASEWAGIREGDRLISSVEVQADGRFRAAESATRRINHQSEL